MKFLSTAFLVTSALMVFHATAAHAAPCIPKKGEAACVGQECAVASYGATTMDSNGQNLVACLSDGAGYVWKSMTSSPALRPTITPITSATCAYSNTTKNSDSTHECPIPANATHLKISTTCVAIGIDGDTKILASFYPSSEPFTAAAPSKICVAHASSGESNSNSAFHLIPVPNGVTKMTVSIIKEHNVADRTAKFEIVPLIIQQ